MSIDATGGSKTEGATFAAASKDGAIEKKSESTANEVSSNKPYKDNPLAQFGVSNPANYGLSVKKNVKENEGEIKISPNGEVEFVPKEGFSGKAEFSVEITRKDGVKVEVKYEVEVKPSTPSYAPKSDPVALTPVLRGGVVTGQLNATTTSQTPLPLVFAVENAPAGGTLVITNPATGEFTYTPAAGYTPDPNTPITFSYTVTDAEGNKSAPISVSLAVEAQPAYTPSSAPVSVTPTFSGGNVSGQLTATTTAETPLPLTYSAVGTPSAGGTVTVNPTTGEFTYTPPAGYTPDPNNPVTFTYTVTDANGNVSDPITVTVTLNRAPVATASSLTTNEDTAGTGTLTGTDEDGNSLTYALATNPTKGTVSLTSSSGAYTYTPNANENGADSFTFTVTDGNAVSSAETVSVTITPVADAPVTTNGSFSTDLEVALNNTLSTLATSVEGNALTFSIVATSSNGVLVLNNVSTGSFTYTPNANFSGSDSFTFKVNDGVDSNTATVSLTINHVNRAPVASAASFSTNEDVAYAGNLSATDADGDTLTYRIGTNPTKGNVSLTASTGAYVYTPTANANGADSFTFIVNDGTADSSTTTITITINALNDLPVTVNGNFSTTEETTLNDSLNSLTTDVDGDALTFAIVTDVSNGTLNLTDASTGSFTYTPDTEYTGIDSFTFRVSDAAGNSNTSTATVTTNGAMLCTGRENETTWDAGEDGTSLATAYVICNRTTWNLIADNAAMMTKIYKLGADIDCTGGCTQIGSNINPFKGTFNGRNFNINNLDLTGTGDYQGLFRYVQNNTTAIATIKDLTVNYDSFDILTGGHRGGLVGYSTGTATYKNIIKNITVNFSSPITLNISSHFGGVVGYASDTTMEDLTVNWNLNFSASQMSIAGGIVGFAFESTLTNAVFQGTGSFTITGGWGSDPTLGGIVGFASTNVSLTNVHNKIPLAIIGDELGGVVGVATNNIDITQSSNTAALSVTNGSYAGGIAGRLDGNNSSSISKSFNTGAVSGTYNYIAGIVGTTDADITKSYNTGNVSGQSFVGGIAGRALFSSITDCYVGSQSVSTLTITSSDGSDRTGGAIGSAEYSQIERVLILADIVGGGAGSTNIGAIAGFNDTSSYTANYWDSSRLDTFSSNATGTAATTAELTTTDTTPANGLIDLLENNGFTHDVNNWDLSTGAYPTLGWE